MEDLKLILDDKVLFLIVHIAFFLLFCFALYADWLENRNKGVRLTIKRSAKTLAIFYSFYVVLSGIVLTTLLEINVIENHRIFWISVDLLALAYLCLFNKWMRNSILGFAIKIEKLEEK